MRGKPLYIHLVYKLQCISVHLVPTVSSWLRITPLKTVGDSGVRISRSLLFKLARLAVPIKISYPKVQSWWIVSLPRPLIPLLLFLYRLAKYYNSSVASTTSSLFIEANLVTRSRMVAMWNLFWCDCKHETLLALFSREGVRARFLTTWIQLGDSSLRIVGIRA